MRKLKFAFRTLLKTPSVTIIAVISLALGIGATTAVFSVLNAVALRALPVTEPERLVVIQVETSRQALRTLQSTL